MPSLANTSLFQVSSGDGHTYFSHRIFEVKSEVYDLIFVGQFLGNLLGIILVTRLGRRPLLMMSHATSVISMGALGAYFHILRTDPATAEFLTWLPLASLVLFISGLAMGVGPLAWLVSSEVLPAKIRGHGGAIAALSNFGFSFIVTKTFVDLQRTITPAGVFWFYGITSFIGILFALFVLPETKDKTSDEIGALFDDKQCND